MLTAGSGLRPIGCLLLGRKPPFIFWIFRRCERPLLGKADVQI